MFEARGFVNIIEKDGSRGFHADIKFNDDYENGSIYAASSKDVLQVSYAELRTQSEPHFYFNKDTLVLKVVGISSRMMLNSLNIDNDLEIIINNAGEIYESLIKHGHSIKIDFACACD